MTDAVARNCENFFFTPYSSGADILMQDTYMIGNNVTFSSNWGYAATIMHTRASKMAFLILLL